MKRYGAFFKKDVGSSTLSLRVACEDGCAARRRYYDGDLLACRCSTGGFQNGVAGVYSLGF